MKHPFLPLCLAGMLATVTTGCALDLTPHFVTNEAVQIPCFFEGKTKYMVRPPTGVTTSGGDGEVTFYFSQLNGASFTMQPSPFQPSMPFSDAALEGYQKALTSFLPRGAQEVALRKEEQPALKINDWSGYKFTVDYKLPGRSCAQSVTYLNFSAQQQIVLIVTAPTEDLQKAEALALRIMQTWHTLQPGEDPTVPPPI